MSSSPAFQFYTKDFITGTVHMTAEEVGAYIRLLCHQWEHGSIPDTEIRQLRVAGCKKQALEVVLEKFIKTEKGIINKRLEESREQQMLYKQKQSENGKKGGRPKKENPEKPTALVWVSKTESETLSETEAKESSSSSSSTSLNDMCIRARDITCKYFAISEIKNYRAFVEITNALKLLQDRDQLSYYISQIEAYRRFKQLTGQQKCNYITWIFGETAEEKHIDNGHWCRMDYDQLVKQTENEKSESNTRRQSRVNSPATAAIASGMVKDFGDGKM